MRQMTHTAASAEPPPPGDLDALREQFPHRRIWQARREDGTAGDYYASTTRAFTDDELDSGGVKTVFASTIEGLRVLLARQPDAAGGDV